MSMTYDELYIHVEKALEETKRSLQALEAQAESMLAALEEDMGQWEKEVTDDPA